MEWLKQILGDAYTDDIARQIAVQIGRDFVARADFNDVNQAKKELAAQLSMQQEKLAKLEGEDVQQLQQQLEQLQQQRRQADDTYQMQMQKMKLEAAVELALRTCEAKNPDALRGLIDFSKVTMDEDGLQGLDEQIAKIKEENEFLFVSKPSSTGMAHGRVTAFDPFLQAARLAAGLKDQEAGLDV